MNVFIGVFPQQLAVRLQRVMDLDFRVVAVPPERLLRAVRIGERHQKIVDAYQLAFYAFAGRKCQRGSDRSRRRGRICGRRRFLAFFASSRFASARLLSGCTAAPFAPSVAIVSERCFAVSCDSA